MGGDVGEAFPALYGREDQSVPHLHRGKAPWPSDSPGQSVQSHRATIG